MIAKEDGDFEILNSAQASGFMHNIGKCSSVSAGIGIVIGKNGKNISIADADDHVIGLTSCIYYDTTEGMVLNSGMYLRTVLDDVPDLIEMELKDGDTTLASGRIHKTEISAKVSEASYSTELAVGDLLILPARKITELAGNSMGVVLQIPGIGMNSNMMMS
jgi:hypothetical protein